MSAEHISTDLHQDIESLRAAMTYVQMTLQTIERRLAKLEHNALSYHEQINEQRKQLGMGAL
jgi:uncharacterized membrane protein